MGKKWGRRRFRRTRTLEMLACAQSVKTYMDKAGQSTHVLDPPAPVSIPTPLPTPPSVPVPTKEKVVTPKKNLNRLEQRGYYKLYKWLEEHVPNLAPGITRDKVAEMATADLKFICTEWHIRGALETCGLSLPVKNTPLALEEKIKVLANAVAQLYLEAHIPIPDDVKHLT